MGGWEGVVEGALKGAIMASGCALGALNTFDTFRPRHRHFHSGAHFEEEEGDSIEGSKK